MTNISDLDGKTCKFIPVDELRIGHLTAMGTVTEEPQFSPSRKTVLVTVETHSGSMFTDRRSAAAKIAIWVTACECGQPGTEVCYRRGSSDEIWFCGSRKHTAKIRELAAQGWLSQSAVTAVSPVGIAIRRRMQAA